MSSDLARCAIRDCQNLTKFPEAYCRLCQAFQEIELLKKQIEMHVKRIEKLEATNKILASWAADSGETSLVRTRDEW
jgi:hypothetical protein